MQIEQTSKYRQIIEPTGKQKVPVVFNIPRELLPDQATIEQLVHVASNEHVFRHVAALTDIHQKPGRKNPSGSVVATKRYFLPQLIDTAPNCGMRMMATPFSEQDLTEKQIDELFNELVNVIPTKTLVGYGSPISHETIIEISRRGSVALLESLKEDTSQVENMLMGGSMFGDEKITRKELFKAIPKMFFKIAQLRLGILGAAGNHFLDLMKVSDIMDPKLADKFKLKKGQYVFLMHTGSGLFGQYASYFYTPKQKEHLSQRAILELARFFFLNDEIAWHRTLETEIPKYKNLKEFFAIDSESELGRNYFIAHRAAGNHGFANRTMLQHNIEKSIKKVLKKDNALRLIYDMSHVYASKERHFDENVIVHRNNATRAFGPSRMQNTPFADSGEPIFMPSSMSTEAYFGVGTDNNEVSFFSAAHGTGKSKTKTSEVPKNKEELLKKMEQRKVRLYNAESRGIINQDASHYKDPSLAIEGSVANNVIKPVAKMMPVAVLMA